MAGFFGSLFKLTATLIGVVAFLITFAVFARAGLLDEAGRAIVALVLLPVKIADLLIRIGGAIIDGGAFGGSGGTPPTTT
jgi:hypothetical protein